ncbi:glutamate synthase small subunit [Rhodococcus hoagii]|uniref:Glutamate synthase subunit beta n=4 Tax=Rhodococcus hoagii TaxID=43767 RepID=E9T817_RHOHA|nr:glutamate synthase subunit beta [Prescottella equi]MBU4615791.1 glutamate synthase subunit beta [Rhodococcus sp. GG48]GBF16520.1 glutamate synthase [NADPH] small chain [Rhodococcus sp. Br-6]AVP66514.1 glutamate synthase subunit beta [Prescottella equi]EGD21421.1 glutamate synthase subunit beta [Prescottella equi ATCC 33707]ERN47997.1 glutamate synthase subunit beta [Prescottella equi NBRC 101255 = C 7]
MGDPNGFLKHTSRELPIRRPVPLRLMDWKEVYEDFSSDTLKTQASRCMDCGIPFCHNGCPLGNLIPEWNDLVYKDRWREGIDRLHATNNFPEFTGRLCPAPCEASCVLGINQDAVTIKQVEVEIIDRAFDEGWVQPVRASHITGKKVAVVGSGPAGLAAAQQLTRAGHSVTVFEREDRIGGLLRYGIPEFKMEKRHIDRRLAQMEAEGTVFRTGVNVGVDITAEQLREQFDAVVLAGGATEARDLPIPGRELDGIHQAMEFLPIANRVQLGDLAEPTITAKGKKVVIIGGGDTGADCLGTSHRQGAESVHQFEIMPRPPAERAGSTPWPTYPLMYRVSSAHEEGGERVFSVNTEEFVGRDGKVTALKAHEVEMVNGRFQKVEGSDFELEADIVFLAMGFVGPEKPGLLTDLGVDLNERGNVARSSEWATNVDGVFVAGDMGRGQSLIVWAIAEGRSCAAAVDKFLEGSTALPTPISTTSAPQR